ncbi:WD40 repeat domain-containing protein [Sulfurovum sp. CS9]|uniref:WD40 repeat domain-containing protein n=1 Tax=Sulfurovum sp. CS9 TaxID=3391146 RepID=UPI0039E74B87
MRFIAILFFMFITLVDAKELQPTHVYTGSGAVTDLVYQDGLLYSATAEGAVDIFNTKEQNLTQTITVPRIKDFTGEEVNAKVYSVDIVDAKIMIVSQGKMGYRRVHIFEQNTLTEIISTAKSFTIAKAKFVDANTLLIALLSNELILYDIKNDKSLYREQIAGSKFSNFALNEDKTQVIIADESGDMKLINVKDGKMIKEIKGQNLDNVFQVDFKNKTIVTAGQDRRCAVYGTEDSRAYYKQASFLIYSVGLSPSAKLAGFASDENNNVTIFNTQTKSDLYKLGNHKMTLTNILFINEEELFTSSDSKEINYWRL